VISVACARQRRELQTDPGARRQARRRNRSFARRRRCRLRAERAAGRADGQDHRARAVRSRSGSAARSST
jgi:hypothetical protein